MAAHVVRASCELVVLERVMFIHRGLCVLHKPYEGRHVHALGKVLDIEAQINHHFLSCFGAAVAN
jgi:hypothetical protein